MGRLPLLKKGQSRFQEVEEARGERDSHVLEVPQEQSRLRDPIPRVQFA